MRNEAPFHVTFLQGTGVSTEIFGDNYNGRILVYLYWPVFHQRHWAGLILLNCYSVETIEQRDLYSPLHMGRGAHSQFWTDTLKHGALPWTPQRFHPLAIVQRLLHFQIPE